MEFGLFSIMNAIYQLTLGLVVVAIISGATAETWKHAGVWGVPIVLLIGSLTFSAVFFVNWFGVVLICGSALTGLSYLLIFLHQLVTKTVEGG